MNKVNDIIIYIGTDKIIHFLCNIIIVILLMKWTNTIIISGIITFGIGIIKEVYDSMNKSKVEYKDIIANICGIGTGIILWIL